ncbi:MAG: thymidylate kinase, partial [Thaumarchaeota archaeon]|nr:thymidylate kinase [Nitrososphaerota archaeon]
EAGMDMNLSNDQYESYRIFQGRIIEQYDSLAESEGFTVIDGTLNIEEQQNIVRKKIMPLLEDHQPKTRKRR